MHVAVAFSGLSQDSSSMKLSAIPKQCTAILCSIRDSCQCPSHVDRQLTSEHSRLVYRFGVAEVCVKVVTAREGLRRHVQPSSCGRVSFQLDYRPVQLLSDRPAPASHLKMMLLRKDIKALKAHRDSTAAKDDISRVRTEMKKLYDGLPVGEHGVLLLRVHVLKGRAQSSWTCALMFGVFVSQPSSCQTASPYLPPEQDLHSLSKKEATTVRVV